MTKPRRKPATSIEGTISLIEQAAKGPHKPPAHVRMRDVDMPFWAGIMNARARDDWSKCDLVVAAQLARTQADIERESELLDTEGTTSANRAGETVINPRVVVVERMAAREMALLRTLRLGGLGNGANAKERRRLEMQAEQITQESTDEVDSELLA